MAVGFALVILALSASLFYKGYRGWSWPEFYSKILSGKGA